MNRRGFLKRLGIGVASLAGVKALGGSEKKDNICTLANGSKINLPTTGRREDLSDLIFTITPEQAPLFSCKKMRKVKRQGQYGSFKAEARVQAR